MYCRNCHSSVNNTLSFLCLNQACDERTEHSELLNDEASPTSFLSLLPSLIRINRSLVRCSVPISAGGSRAVLSNFVALRYRHSRFALMKRHRRYCICLLPSLRIYGEKCRQSTHSVLIGANSKAPNDCCLSELGRGPSSSSRGWERELTVRAGQVPNSRATSAKEMGATLYFHIR